MTEPERHAYTSTACHHELHEQCRQTCKFCDEACRCKCHYDQFGDLCLPSIRFIDPECERHRRPA